MQIKQTYPNENITLLPSYSIFFKWTTKQNIKHDQTVPTQTFVYLNPTHGQSVCSGAGEVRWDKHAVCDVDN